MIIDPSVSNAEIALFFYLKDIEAEPLGPINRGAITLKTARLNADLEWKVAPGSYKIPLIRIRQMTNTEDLDVDVSHISVNLRPGVSYKVSGQLIFGSVYKYWIEERSSEKKITDTFYDPIQLKSMVVVAEERPIHPADSASIRSNVPKVFPNKLRLNPGKDCFNLVEETIIDQGLVMLSMLVPYKTQLYRGEPGFKVYEEICIPVQPGTTYWLSSRRKETFSRNPKHHGTHSGTKLIDIWDRDRSEVIQTLDLSKLGVILEGIE
ncbi:MAG: hypothetical protein ABJK25_02525 [Halieaceae bacterium]